MWHQIVCTYGCYMIDKIYGTNTISREWIDIITFAKINSIIHRGPIHLTANTYVVIIQNIQICIWQAVIVIYDFILSNSNCVAVNIDRYKYARVQLLDMEHSICCVYTQLGHTTSKRLYKRGGRWFTWMLDLLWRWKRKGLQWSKAVCHFVYLWQSAQN